MAQNPAQKLIGLGQSVWYDNISREIIENGDLKRLISEWGVRGLTSNPTIFDAALSKGSAYDKQIQELKPKNLSTDALFDELALQDIAAAADLLRPVYDQSQGTDGFVSIEVSPLLARDTAATLAEAKRLNARLERPNIMIKIPGTKEGLPAVRACLEDGINVNITLLFSLDNYTEVAKVYCEALRARHKRGFAVDKIRSVASFFVSRVDTIIDESLKKIAASDSTLASQAETLKGKFGIANCKIVYKRFQEIFHSAAFSDLRAAGAAVQRPLWASTSTKNPAFRDVIYVEQLIGPDTVNTMPHVTLAAFVDHGELAETITSGVEEAEKVLKDLLNIGVKVDACLEQLQIEGVDKFSQSFVALNNTLKSKLG